MTRRQRIEAKFGNVARALVQARAGYKKSFGFIHTTCCRGFMPRYQRWKERLRLALLHR